MARPSCICVPISGHKQKLTLLSRLQTNKFSMTSFHDKFYLPSARVYMQYILYDKFSYDKFYFTGVNVSTSLL